MKARLEEAIGRAPWDRELRLVYADWLEENGDLEAAREQRRAAGKKQRRPARGILAGGRETCQSTSNRTIYQRLHREGVSRRCDVCPPHRGCNARKRPRHTSWRESRKHRWRDS
jgi:uncharacterized protein (TIGR02996 family)